MNFAMALAQNKISGVKVETSRFDVKPERVARQVLFRDATSQTRDAINKALADRKDKDKPAVVAGLVIGSPDFQRR
jgi:hypothetical protein